MPRSASEHLKDVLEGASVLKSNLMKDLEILCEEADAKNELRIYRVRSRPIMCVTHAIKRAKLANGGTLPDHHFGHEYKVILEKLHECAKIRDRAKALLESL